LPGKQLTIGFEFTDFGFFLIDEPYLKYLHDIDEGQKDPTADQFFIIRKPSHIYVSALYIRQGMTGLFLFLSVFFDA